MIVGGAVNGFRAYCETRWFGLPLQHGFGCRDVTLQDYLGDGCFPATTQVHGAAVHVFTTPLQAHYRGDAWLTQEPGVVVAVRTADCVPVLLYHRRLRLIAAIHAGWRGLVAGVIQATIATAGENFRADPNGWEAAVGPCIGAEAFEVDAPVLTACEQAGLPVDRHVRASRPDHWYCDLRGLVAHALTAAGVPPENISVSSLCTVARSGDFHSWRRDRSPEGRQINFLVLL